MTPLAATLNGAAAALQPVHPAAAQVLRAAEGMAGAETSDAPGPLRSPTLMIGLGLALFAAGVVVGLTVAPRHDRQR